MPAMPAGLASQFCRLQVGLRQAYEVCGWLSQQEAVSRGLAEDWWFGGAPGCASLHGSGCPA